MHATCMCKDTSYTASNSGVTAGSGVHINRALHVICNMLRLLDSCRGTIVQRGLIIEFTLRWWLWLGDYTVPNSMGVVR